MAKSTKTWKIGEYCIGGIITVNITGKVIQIQIKDWDMSKGTRRSSDQSNAKVLFTGTVDTTDRNAYRKVYDFLIEQTTSYYTEQVIEWIEGKVGKLNTEFNW